MLEALGEGERTPTEEARTETALPRHVKLSTRGESQSVCETGEGVEGDSGQAEEACRKIMAVIMACETLLPFVIEQLKGTMAEDQNGNLEKRKLAILIDGDNAQSGLVKQTLAEASKYGRITIRRIYGDWTTPNMNGWKESLQDNAIQPMQQFRYTIGKNATDSAMIIDAMDILHSGVVEGFCLATSDSDYTRLATRLRESGAFVMGIGRSMTPKAFISACDLFVFLENLVAPVEGPPDAPKAKVIAQPKTSLHDALPLLRQAYDLRVQEDEWTYLGTIGNALRSLDPSFDHRTFGCSSLRGLVASFPNFIELREETASTGSAAVFMRFK